jgi:hypothetical protein
MDPDEVEQTVDHGTHRLGGETEFAANHEQGCSNAAAGEAPGEVAPHQCSVNTCIIRHGRNGTATAVRALRNEVELSANTLS